MDQGNVKIPGELTHPCHQTRVSTMDCSAKRGIILINNAKCIVHNYKADKIRKYSRRASLPLTVGRELAPAVKGVRLPCLKEGVTEGDGGIL